MTKHDKPGSKPQDNPPAGSQLKGRSERENPRVREDAQKESSGDAPIDPADEGFIESTRK